VKNPKPKKPTGLVKKGLLNPVLHPCLLYYNDAPPVCIPKFLVGITLHKKHHQSGDVFYVI